MPRTWKQRTSLGNGPGSITSSPLAYMPGIGTVMYGGNRGEAPSDNDFSEDMWIWDGSTWDSPCNAVEQPCGPGPVSAHSLVYDENNERLLLFGGVRPGAPNAPSDEFWQYSDAGGWSLIPYSGSWPSPRFDAAMAYDPVRRTTLLFGGRNQDGFREDAWLYNGTDWVSIVPAPGLSGRAPGHSAAVFAQSLDGVAIYGGTLGGAVRTDELWTWSTDRWQRVCEVCTGVGRSSAALVYDTDSAQLLLLGGNDVAGDELAGTLVYNPSSQAFESISPENLPARSSHGATYDRERGQVVSFGGTGPSCPGQFQNCDQTWEFGR